MNQDSIYRYGKLKAILQTEKGEELVRKTKYLYEKYYADKEISSLRYSSYVLYYKTGNREEYEQMYFRRRERLMFLQILAVADDEYIGELENILAAICDEYTWVLPAHNLKEGHMFDYTVVDLLSAETGMYLAMTAAVMGEKLCPDIRYRIRRRLKERITDNFESRLFNFDNVYNNWASVCACGVGCTYLYAFPERFPIVEDRIFKCMDHFVRGIGKDGYCPEGVNYWHYGFGMFALFYDSYVQETGKRPEILDRETVYRTLEFPDKAYLGGGRYLPFADGGADEIFFNAGFITAIENLYEDRFVCPPIDSLSAMEESYYVAPGNRFQHSRAVGYQHIYGLKRLSEKTSETKKDASVYFSSGEVFIRKKENYTFTAKCGRNYESHNHNDIGVFEIVRKGDRPILDIGAGEYTKDYFNDDVKRYGKEIFVCGAWSHSVPILDGQPQQYGYRYKGEVLRVGEDLFRLDISRAYDVETNFFTIEYRCKENSVEAEYEFGSGEKRQVTYRFVSEFEPAIEEDSVRIRGMKIFCDKRVKPRIERATYAAHQKDGAGVAWLIDFARPETMGEKVIFTFALDE